MQYAVEQCLQNNPFQYTDCAQAAREQYLQYTVNGYVTILSFPGFVRAVLHHRQEPKQSDPNTNRVPRQTKQSFLLGSYPSQTHTSMDMRYTTYLQAPARYLFFISLISLFMLSSRPLFLLEQVL